MKKLLLVLGVLSLAACTPSMSPDDSSSLLNELTKEPDSGMTNERPSVNPLEENDEAGYEYSPTESPVIEE